MRSKSGHCVYGDEPLGTPLRNLAPAQGSRKQVHVLPASESPNVGSDSTTVSRVVGSIVASSATPLTAASQPSHEVEYLKNRVRLLEEHLSQAAAKAAASPNSTSTPALNIETTSSSLAGTFSVRRESHAPGGTPTINRGIFHKSRLFGQSHWANGMVQVS